ncbi:MULTISPECIES: hypothetical protein [Hyphobacterium]|uniref:Uncharacterized protein n=1 Tax=Hyphobacterium vulgare TaxID=1736751 RepID=A0ABV6ZWD9_9PROT
MARWKESSFNQSVKTAALITKPAFWLRALRSFASYLLACLAAASLTFLAVSTISPPGIVLPMTHEQLLFVAYLLALTTAFIAVVSAIPAIAAVFIVRSARWPRGWCDALAGGLIGLVASLIFLQGLNLDQYHLLGLISGIAGAIAGLVYWLANARPRPPYRAAR